MAKEDTGGLVAMPQALVELLLEKLGAPAQVAQGMTAEQLADILKSTGLSTASAMQQALRPEHQFHPGVSAYSYPEGDRDRPRPVLKCQMTWVAAWIDPETEHWYELELLNQMQPGEYVVTNADMTKTMLTVRPEMDSATGKLDKLHFTFPVRDGQNRLVSPKAVWLLEALAADADPATRYMTAITTWLIWNSCWRETRRRHVAPSYSSMA